MAELTTLTYEYVDDMLERRIPHREAHLEQVDRWSREGGLVMAGALGDPPHGALFVFDGAGRTTIEEFVMSDPYFEARLITHSRIEPWNLVVQRLGAG